MTIGIGIGVHKKRRTSAVIPTLVSAYTSNVYRNAIYFIVSTLLDDSYIIDQSIFIVKINGITQNLEDYFDGVNVGKATFELTYDGFDFAYGDIITVSYTQPALNPLQGLDGGLVASFVDYPVVNNIE